MLSTARFPIYKFKEIKRLNSYWSSYVCFCETLRDAPNISKKTLGKHFDALIDEDDYLKSEKGRLLKYLETTFL